MHPKTILQQYGLSPKKGLGQNFLYNDGIAANVVAAGDITAEDNVLEIGSGLGILTRSLAMSAGQVIAVELDDRLQPILERELSQFANIRLMQGDILEQTPTDWFGPQDYKVVANIPYYITGAILRHLLSIRPRAQLITLTVQQEVAQRLTAQPGDMSLLAVSVQCFGEVSQVGKIGAGSFWPRPDVDSAIVRIDLRQPPTIEPEDEAQFFRLVRAGFGQKRKQLQKNLRVLGLPKTAIQAALTEAGIAGNRRAETLSVSEWATLLQALPLPTSS